MEVIVISSKLMAEIWRSPPGMVLKPYNSWDKLPINWCRISAINSSKLVYFTYLRDLQRTYIGVIIHLLSTMDIPAGVFFRFCPERLFGTCISARPNRMMMDYETT